MKIEYSIRVFYMGKNEFFADGHEYWLVLRGDGQIADNRSTVCFQQHDVLEIPCKKSYRMDCEGETHVAVFLLNGEENANTVLQKKDHTNTELIRRVYFFAVEFQGFQHGMLDSMMYHVDQLMIDALRYTGMETYKINPELGGILEEMCQHYLEPDYDYHEVFRSSKYSDSHLRKLFREETGYSPNAWIQKRRVERAKYLLCEPVAKTVREIAEACGYPDAYYFSRVFRKMEGMSPVEYRRLHNELHRIDGDAE